MDKQIINISNLKQNLREQLIEQKHGLYRDDLLIKKLIQEIQFKNNDFEIYFENTLLDYIYKIAVDFYDSGFDDARLLLKQFINLWKYFKGF